MVDNMTLVCPSEDGVKAKVSKGIGGDWIDCTVGSAVEETVDKILSFQYVIVDMRRYFADRGDWAVVVC
jgi:hypothetical protein